MAPKDVRKKKIDYIKQAKRSRAKGYAGETFVRQYLRLRGFTVRRINALEQKTVRGGVKSPDLIVKKDTDIEIVNGLLFPIMVQKYECSIEVKWREYWKENEEETRRLKLWGKANKMPIYYGIVKKNKNKKYVLFSLIKGDYWSR